jgi:hypothetical protein
MHRLGDRVTGEDCEAPNIAGICPEKELLRRHYHLYALAMLILVSLIPLLLILRRGLDSPFADEFNNSTA